MNQLQQDCLQHKPTMSQGNKRSSNSMKRRENLEIIPIDLIIEIFSRLPGKSIARFRSLSKLWGSMLRRSYFTEMFLTMSSARPRLLFAVERDSEWLLFSSPQPQNREKSSLVATNFHMKFSSKDIIFRCSYASGLIFFSYMWISKEAVPVILNPITGQYAILPKLIGWYEEFYSYKGFYSFLGFDPIDKQFKVLWAYSYGHVILTLETGIMRWRRIQCPLTHAVCCRGICINGVLYYIAKTIDEMSYVIVCFDVRFEKFKFIDAKLFCDPYYTHLINYKGRLGGICWEYTNDTLGLCLCMWILEDVEKNEWSKFFYTFVENKIIDIYYLSVVGVTATGEIVLSMDYTCKPFNVFYFNPERNTLQSVEIQGFGSNRGAFETDCRVHIFVDYVEDLSINDAKQLNSSIFAPSVKKNSSLNIITKRPKPQHREEVRERDMDKRYDDGVSRENIHSGRRNERDSRDDDDRRRKRRHGYEIRDREWRVESRRYRDDRWSDKECRSWGRMRDNERRDR